MRLLIDWLNRRLGRGAVSYQLWVEYPALGDNAWKLEEVGDTWHSVESEYLRLVCDKDTPKIGGWYILKTEVVA